MDTWKRAALGVIVLCGLLVGCGGGDDDDDATAGQETSDAEAPTGDPIVIGNIGTYSGGPAATGVPDTGKRVIEAWVKAVNAAGGINGHPLKVIVEDDQNDPVKSKAAIEKLVERDKVVAIVSSNSASFDSTWAEYLKEKGIPVLGGQSYTPPWFTNPMFFLNGPEVLTQVYNEPYEAKQAGYKNYGLIICAESTTCAQAIPLHKTGAEKAGINFPYSASATATAANYTAQCVEARDAKVDILAIAGPDPARFRQDCERQNFKPDWLVPAGALTRRSAEDLGGTIVSPVQTFPFFYEGSETKEFRDAMDRFAGIDEDDWSMTMSTTWVAGKMFEKAVELSGATGVPTTADVLRGLHAFDKETLGGLAVPLTFGPQGSPRPDGGRIKCYFIAGAEDGELKAPEKLTTRCIDF